MDTREVTVSGAVGKQVFPTSGTGTRPVLKGFLLSPISAAGRIVIRDGNASGAVKFQQSVAANDSSPVLFPSGVRFDKGMHVKVLGTGATAYLFLD